MQLNYGVNMMRGNVYGMQKKFQALWMIWR